MSSYLDAIREFNKLSGFQLVIPENEDIVTRLEPYVEKVRERIVDVQKYESIRKRGFSDDHLATEIGLFVMHLNQISRGVKDASLMDTY